MIVGMRAVVITGERRLESLDVPDPVPVPGGVVVDIALCGICGTDVHAYAHGGRYPPTLCGHEWTGTVSAVAGDVNSFAEGDRVSVGIPLACGTCLECRAGLTGWCRTATRSLASDPAGSAHGGYATRIAASAARLVPVPPGMPEEVAAMIEPATVAFHGVARSGLHLGDLVVVQGAGPIGAFALQWARLGGARLVVVVEPTRARAALARELGADVVVHPGDEAKTAVRDHSGGLGADVVIECAGVPSTIQTAVDLVRRGGQVALIGLSDRPATIVPGSWLMKEAVVRAFIAYVRSDFEHTTAMLASGRIHAHPLHTSTVGLDGLERAFAALSDGGSTTDVKILVRPA
jgi:2-desacetyl-2-hydroxyethyl bacteriochlorophyllide A dehydrogenase